MLFDTRLGVNVPVGDKKAEWYLGVTNVLNKIINPYVTWGASGISDFDAIGRTFRLGVRFDL